MNTPKDASPEQKAVRTDPTQISSGDQSPNIRTESGSVSISYNTGGALSLTRIIPEYFDQLLALLCGPRQFFANLDGGDAKLFSGGVLFLCLSSLLGFLLRITVTATQNSFGGQALTAAVFYLATGLCLGVVAFFCCRCLGGKGTLRGHLGTFSYIAGVSVTSYALVMLIAQAVILLTFPQHFDIYQSFLATMFDGSNPPTPNELAPGLALEASIAILVAGTLAILGWMAVAWAGLRDLNRFSAGRSRISMLLFLFFGYWVSLVLAELQYKVGAAVF